MDKPKAFVSYSWSSPDHEQRVLNLSTELVDSGVDIILDKWDLKEGNDANVFMEKMVSDTSVNKVLMICDKTYAEKANKREGGVGTEAQIISGEIYKKINQDKFVAIVVEKDESGNAYLPTYYKSRIYIDLSRDNDYSKGFEQLLRWIFDKPLYKKPDLGTPPSFLNDNDEISLKTSAIFIRLIDAIKYQKDNRFGILNEYFMTIISNFEQFRLSSNGDNAFDDKVISSINNFLPYRNEFIEIMNTTCLYGYDDNVNKEVFKFFELLLPYLDKPQSISQWRDCDFDNYKFIIHELFLYLIAILIKHEHYQYSSYFLSNKYYLRSSRHGESQMVHFSYFHNPLSSLYERNRRLNKGRLSLHADILKDRAQSSLVDFNHIMQGDFILFIRSLLDLLKSTDRHYWFPQTLLYMSHWPQVFEIFLRSEATAYFNNVKILFNINDKIEFGPLLEMLRKDVSYVPKWQHESINPEYLLNYKKLCSY